MILLELTLSLSLPHVAKMQCFVNVRFNFTFQLISGISYVLQKLFRYFGQSAIVVFSRTSFAAVVLPINLAL